ncbi:hypothetical protein H8356DRAFT_1752819 [Neocallimastix lanati (nom. inval.)]|jgi:hypothetical protein|uniref:Uncharacterized protein n=1 Tax=Neocallimastix californiae TaxID=1754190 RepID=A0A1Y1Z712_9FUNG|nr:hypothetical protein H8356DRAFT_1752819 [Neocallimastix sp. JGI-2020a]ORY05595.1 hypothetical protein LY90DRAFT_639443 [Neocallimastix californiae]|eukprot:ORY05595.1 hypothetical protein LY90DRAFT_639443 [Neocallimastix californiae]
MFRKNIFFTKLVILLCLLSLIHGRKCFVKPKNKVIENPDEIINEIETAIPLKNEIDSESDSDSESENNIKTITNSQSIDTVISTIEISSSTIEIHSSTIEISSSTPVEISSTTIDASSSTLIEISSTTIDISSSTSVPTETESSVFTSTTENDEPTSTFSPIPTETIDEYEEPTEYELKVKLEITEDIKDTLKDLKNKYPEYFKNYKSSSDFICDDLCFLNKLALVKLSNDIKLFIDENKNLMNELLLYKYERDNYPLYHNYLPHDDACYYNAAVHPINYDKDFSGFFYIFTYSNDNIMERVKNHFEKNIVSYKSMGVIELEDIDF